jgi:MoaA/NifB/PqqE/SkfB family radical SAM enzyme
MIAKAIGAGFLSFENFKKFIDKNPWVSDIELSKWGEIFLNPELKKIIHFAYKKNVVLRADNGANLNSVSEDVPEALVRYKFRSVTCSIDGANQGTYSTYRVNGDYGRVIENIKKINFYKNKHRSIFPKLRWQYIAFGHNEHEISKAKALARELDMSFYLKLSWDDLYTDTFSPVKNLELIRRESGFGVAGRQEFEKKYGKNYIDKACQELWLLPRINFDGKLLGCCVNHWADFGNIFESGLEKCLSSEKVTYAKQMLLGLKPARPDIACSNCKIYEARKKNNDWIDPLSLSGPYVESREMVMLNNRVTNPFINRLVKLLISKLKNKS